MKHQASAEHVQIGEKVVITIKKLGINGEGVGYYRRKAVFIEGALPGEVVHATITAVEAKFLHASLLKIEKKSAARIKSPKCPLFVNEACGGCQLWHFDYKVQLAEKTEIVRESFRRYMNEQIPEIREMIGMEEPSRYRNKAQFQLGYDKHGRVIAGLYKRNSHELLDLSSGCLVQAEGINHVLNQLTALINELRIPVVRSSKSKVGLRSLVVREGFGGALQVTLVSISDEIPQVDTLIRLLREHSTKIATIAQNVNRSASPLVFGEVTRILWGAETMDMQLGELTFKVSPRAFFQLNTAQTIILYEAVREAAKLTGKELVVDAYCGTGTIGLWLAKSAAAVRGVEMISEAVLDARSNAKRNGLHNATFFIGKTETVLPEWIREGIVPDVIVVDPPRTGCDARLLEAIIQSKCERLVYVSCNPSTLAKDSAILIKGGYKIDYVQPIDMFPQTSHVECVVRFVWKSSCLG
jgi:23S rRNA (uracil-5-)-methyltransferase RumA